MMHHIFLGIKAYAGTFKLISKLKLWKYFLIPIAISVVAALTISFLAWSLSDNIGLYISKLWLWEWGKSVFNTIGNFIGGIVILLLGLILYKHIIMALSAPFMSPVSEKIEDYLIGIQKHHHRETSFSEQLWRGIVINVRNLFKELIFTIPIFFLGFIPIIGVFSTVLLFLVQAYYAGFGNMDYTLERHYNYHQSISFVRKHRGFALGNGIVFMLFLLIPVVGIILVLPLSVTAASSQTVGLIKKENQELSLS